MTTTAVAVVFVVAIGSFLVGYGMRAIQSPDLDEQGRADQRRRFLEAENRSLRQALVGLLGGDASSIR